MLYMIFVYILGVLVEIGVLVVVVCFIYYKIKNYVLLCNYLDDQSMYYLYICKINSLGFIYVF